MSLFFQIILEELDNDLSDKFLDALEKINTYKRQNNLFCDQNFQVFLAYKVTQDYRSALKILNTTKGDQTFNECNRLLLLNQFEPVYKQYSQQILNENALEQKVIAAFYLLGQNEQSIEEFTEFLSDEAVLLRQLIQISNNNLTIDNRIFRLEYAFKQQQLLDKSYKTKYVEKFRVQTYHFQFSGNVNLNPMLIEMSYAQMCQILILPVDYFDAYYDAFEYTIQKIFNNQRKTNQVYDLFLNKISFTNPLIKINDEELFMNAVHTGITRAIINHKIHLNNNFGQSESQTGILDACLILRRLPKWSKLDPIDDLIYETLIYKLQ